MCKGDGIKSSFKWDWFLIFYEIEDKTKSQRTNVKTGLEVP